MPAPKPETRMGTVRQQLPTGEVILYPIFRGLGAGCEEYPHDPDEQDEVDEGQTDTSIANMFKRSQAAKWGGP